MIDTAEKLNGVFRSGRVRVFQLAKELGRTPQQVWKWRKGIHPVPVYVAQHLKNAHGIE